MVINCIICSDLISQEDEIYFTTCGHVFHHHCLAQWIQRSRSCPQCRNHVTETSLRRAYLNFGSEENIHEIVNTLQSELHNSDLQFIANQKKIKSLEDQIVQLKLTENYSKIIKQEKIQSLEYQLKMLLRISETDSKKQERIKYLEDQLNVQLKLNEYYSKIIKQEKIQSSEYHLKMLLRIKERDSKEKHEKTKSLEHQLKMYTGFGILAIIYIGIIFYYI